MTIEDILQEIADSSNRQFGLLPEYPLRTTDVFDSYPFLDRLRRQDGKQFTYDRVGSVGGPSGHILDKWRFKWPGGESDFFVDCYAKMESMCAPRGWILQPKEDAEPYIFAPRQPWIPATWESEDAGESWDFGDAVAIFQTNPRTIIEKACRIRVSQVQDGRKIQKVLPSYIKYPFVLQLIYKPGKSPDGKDLHLPFLVLAIKHLLCPDNNNLAQISLCEFSPAGQFALRDLAEVPSRQDALQMFLGYVKKRFSHGPKLLGTMQDGISLLKTGVVAPVQQPVSSQQTVTPKESTSPCLENQSSPNRVSKNHTDNTPPSVDASLLVPRMKPLAPTSKGSKKSPEHPANSSSHETNPTPPRKDAQKPGKASISQGPSKSQGGTPSPDHSRQSETLRARNGSNRIASSRDSSNHNGEPKGFNWTVLWCVIAILGVFFSIGFYLDCVVQKRENKSLASRLAILVKEREEETEAPALQSPMSVSQTREWVRQKTELEAKIGQLEKEIGRLEGELQRRKSLEAKKEVPRLLVRAMIDGKSISGVKLQFANREWTLPARITLSANGRYQRGFARCRYHGVWYSGWLEGFQATWKGETVATVVLEAERTNNSSDDEFLYWEDWDGENEEDDWFLR